MRIIKWLLTWRIIGLISALTMLVAENTQQVIMLGVYLIVAEIRMARGHE